MKIIMKGGSTMAKKQILTNENIRNDIKNALKHPATLSHAEHRKSMFPLLVFSAIMLIAIVLFQNYYKVVLGIGVAFIVVYLVVDYFRKQKNINNVSIENYEIKAECVSFVKEEIYSTDHKIHLSPTVKKIHTAQIYIMFFDNGKTWNIPKNNYAWSGEFPMSDDFIYKNTHFGDIFWTITEKKQVKSLWRIPPSILNIKNNVI